MPLSRIYFGKPVPPEAFVGRNSLVNDIESLIGQGHNIELVGPHRTGKSALFAFLANKINEDGLRYPIVIDLQHLQYPRFSSFVAKIIGEKENGIQGVELDRYIGADEVSVSKLITHLKLTGKPAVIFIDEMDAALATEGTFCEWNASLRLLSREVSWDSDCDLVIVTSLAVYPRYYENKYDIPRTSKSIGNNYQIDMTPLELSLTSKFIEQKTNNKLDTSFAVKFSGTFPFLLELLILEFNKTDGSTINYKNLLESVYKQADMFYNDIHEFIISYDNCYHTIRGAIYSLAFDQVINNDTKLSPKITEKFDIDQYEIKLLKNIGVITDNNELFSPLFSWWLSRHVMANIKEEDPIAPKILSCLGIDNFKELLAVMKSAHSLSSVVSVALSSM